MIFPLIKVRHATILAPSPVTNSFEAGFLLPCFFMVKCTFLFYHLKFVKFCFVFYFLTESLCICFQPWQPHVGVRKRWVNNKILTWLHIYMKIKLCECKWTFLWLWTVQENEVQSVSLTTGQQNLKDNKGLTFNLLNCLAVKTVTAVYWCLNCSFSFNAHSLTNTLILRNSVNKAEVYSDEIRETKYYYYILYYY